MPNPKSTASIAGHPIHPMLVGFPIRLFRCDIRVRFCVLANRRSILGSVILASKSELGNGSARCRGRPYRLHRLLGCS